MYPCNAKQLGDAWEVSLKEGAHPSTGKGMLFALGTGNGTKPYLNPLEAGLVRVSASSMLENSLTKLVEYPVSKAPYTETEEGTASHQPCSPIYSFQNLHCCHRKLHHRSKYHPRSCTRSEDESKVSKIVVYLLSD